MTFELLTAERINLIIPLVQSMEKEFISEAVLMQRFYEMTQQNYECLGVFQKNQLIGTAGMWFCTRHYSGRSIEIDHVVVDKIYRGQGIGQKMIQWIEQYASSKGYETIELNTYIDNELSHKFYQKQAYKKLGYHFLKSL